MYVLVEIPLQLLQRLVQSFVSDGLDKPAGPSTLLAEIKKLVK